jgi:hypothetical protein
VNWEPEMLQSTGQTIQILGTEALTQTIQQILGATFLATLMAGLSLPIVLTKLAYLVDNPWTVSLARADATGLILADSLIDRNLGIRPITLVGFSLGSRVIFSCLKELSRRGAVGLIQNVYMFGSPVVVKKEEWTAARSVVSGRFVNGYATSDWILAYLFRATAGGIMRVAGLATVDITGIENINVTEEVPGHMAYRGMIPTLLHNIGWQVDNLEFTEIEDPDPENHEKRQRELIYEIEAARAELEEKQQKKGWKSIFSRSRKAPAKKEWETYDERSAQILKGEDSAESERVAAERADVMFDVDAIRREALQLALQGGDLEEIKEHLSIREVESTLPALKIESPTFNSGNGATGKAPGSSDLQRAKTHDGALDLVNGQRNGRSTPPVLTNGHHDATEEEEEYGITMTFDESPVRTMKTSPFAAAAADSSNGTHNESSARPEPALSRGSLGTEQRPPPRSVSTTPVNAASHQNAPAPAPAEEARVDPDYNPWGADGAHGK